MGISNYWCDFVDTGHPEFEHVISCHHFCSNFEDQLCYVSWSVFSWVVGPANLYSHYSGHAVPQIVLRSKAFYALEIRNGLAAHLELFVETLELFVVFLALYLTIHVSVLLPDILHIWSVTYKELHSLYNGVKVLLFFELNLLLGRESSDCLYVVHQ